MSYRQSNTHSTDYSRGSANGSWARPKTAEQNGYTGNGISQKLEGFFDNRQLPMYKDKPYSYIASRRKPALLRRWQVVVGIVTLLVGLFFWCGVLPLPGFRRRMIPPGRVNLGRLRPNQAVDWDDRREKVKEAFMLSWDGYEEYAWGMLIPKNGQRLVCLNNPSRDFMNDTGFSQPAAPRADTIVY